MNNGWLSTLQTNCQPSSTSRLASSTGPSIIGLADPGINMTTSIAQANAILLSLTPNIMGIMVGKMMFELVNEINQNFLKVHQIIKKNVTPKKREKGCEIHKEKL